MTKKMTVQILQEFRAADDEIKLQREMLGELEKDNQNFKISRAGAEAAGNCRMKISQLQALKQTVITALSRLPYTQKDVVWRHYVKCEQWEQIARRHYYSERQIRNVNNQALETLGRELDKLR